MLTDVLTLALRVAGLPSILYLNRPFVIALLTAAVLYPVCSVKDLSGLKSTSVLGNQSSNHNLRHYTICYYYYNDYYNTMGSSKIIMVSFALFARSEWPICSHVCTGSSSVGSFLRSSRRQIRHFHSHQSGLFVLVDSQDSHSHDFLCNEQREVHRILSSSSEWHVSVRSVG